MLDVLLTQRAAGPAVTPFIPVPTDLPVEREATETLPPSDVPQRPRISDEIFASERQVEFGSRAFRRLHAREVHRETQTKRSRSFQDTLIEASSATALPVNSAPQSVAPSANATGNSPAVVSESTNAESPSASPLPDLAAAGLPSAQTPNVARGAPPTVVSTVAPAATAAVAMALQPQVTLVHEQAVTISVATQSSTNSTPAAQRVSPPAVPQVRENRGVVSTARAAKPSALPDAQREAAFERVLRAVSRQLRSSDQRVLLRLDPPALGKLRLEMNLREDQLALQIEPETREAHELLKDDLGRLKERLAAVGIRLEHVEIRPPEISQPEGRQGPDDQPEGQSAGTREDRANERSSSRGEEPIAGETDADPGVEDDAGIDCLA